MDNGLVYVVYKTTMGKIVHTKELDKKTAFSAVEHGNMKYAEGSHIMVSETDLIAMLNGKMDCPTTPIYKSFDHVPLGMDNDLNSEAEC